MSYWCDDQKLNQEQCRLDAEQARAKAAMTPVISAGDMDSLLERVKAATGPDRRLDVAFHVIVTNQGRLGDYASVDEYTNSAIQLGWNTPRVTSSLDAIIELIERELPAWSWKVVREPAAVYRNCAVLRNAGKLSDVAEAHVASQRSAPLALCAAFLSARSSLNQDGGKP